MIFIYSGEFGSITHCSSRNFCAGVASATNATAFGAGANAGLANSVALGAGSVASGASSTAGNAALGVTYNAGAVTPGSGNVVSVGAPGAERQIQNVAAGAITATSTDAVNGSQLYSLATGVNALASQVNKDRIDADRGIAAAMAMAGAPMPSAPGKVSWSALTADYKGQAAFGASIAYRFDTKAPIAFTAGAALGDGNDFGIRAGLQGEF